MNFWWWLKVTIHDLTLSPLLYSFTLPALGLLLAVVLLYYLRRRLERRS